MAKQHIKITITRKGKPIADIARDIETSWFEFQGDMAELGERTAKKMREKIKTGKKRSQAGEPAKLELAIDSELFHNIGGQIPHIGFGVGNIDKLEKKAPYYNAINYGSSHIMNLKGDGRVPLGRFSPGDPRPTIGENRGRWKVGEGNYSFVPKNPIRPINFIEKTEFWLGRQVAKILARHTYRLEKK